MVFWEQDLENNQTCKDDISKANKGGILGLLLAKVCPGSGEKTLTFLLQ